MHCSTWNNFVFNTITQLSKRLYSFVEAKYISMKYLDLNPIAPMELRYIYTKQKGRTNLTVSVPQASTLFRELEYLLVKERHYQIHIIRRNVGQILQMITLPQLVDCVELLSVYFDILLQFIQALTTHKDISML